MRAGLRERSSRRMDEITEYYANRSGVLGVAAFGSNAERERFDDYSDLDFLVFCIPSAKDRLIAEVNSLSALGGIDAIRVMYGDAVQIFFSDGVLCDFGIVLPEQLSTFPHGSGRYLWQNPDWEAVDLSASEPTRRLARELREDALFHLYIGLLRMMRGEEAAAFDEIQVKAADCVLALLQGADTDAFSSFRRAEHFISPEVLRRMMPGYGHNREAAEYLLQTLMQEQESPLCNAVRDLIHDVSQ